MTRALRGRIAVVALVISVCGQVAAQAGVKTGKDTYKSNEMIGVTYSGLPGNQKDWITIVRATAPTNTYDEWYYTSGQTNGTLVFRALPAGSYEVRVYYNWSDGGYNVQGRHAFKVVDPEPEWRAVDVKTERYGLDEFEHGKVLGLCQKAAQQFLSKVHPRAEKLAEQLPKVFSITRAVDVFVTYALVDPVTGKVKDVRVVKLSDADALAWWAKDNESFGRQEKEEARKRAILKNRPR